MQSSLYLHSWHRQASRFTFICGMQPRFEAPFLHLSLYMLLPCNSSVILELYGRSPYIPVDLYGQ
jgi:hypothetical protein